MERLTTKRKDGRWSLRNDDGETPLEQMNKIPRAIERLAAYEDAMPLERVQELAQAEKDGRLVVLPCKVGDVVYQVDYMTHSEALKSGVPQCKDPWQNRKYGRKRAKYLPLIVREKKMVKTLYPKIGKTVFLTREEAEAALEKREEADSRKPEEGTT